MSEAYFAVVMLWVCLGFYFVKEIYDGIREEE